MPINARHVQTEQPELTVRTLPCLPVCEPPAARMLAENRYYIQCQSRQRAHWQVSIWVGTVPCTGPAKKSLKRKGGGLAGLWSGNTPETKSMGDQSCLSPGDAAKHQDEPWNLPNNTRRQRPWLPTVIYCTHWVNTLANKGGTNKDTGTGKSANRCSRRRRWNDLWKANRSPLSSNTALWNIPQQWQPFLNSCIDQHSVNS